LIGPATATELLRPRLIARLDAHFESWRALDHDTGPREEHCVIPMNAPPPPRPARVLAFGAAAGAIHPATGYSVGWSATHAAPLAASLAASNRAGLAPAAAAAAAWDQLWPRDQQRTRTLYRKGAALLAQLSTADVSSFFSAFFAQPPAQWAGFMCRTLPVSGVLQAMLGTFLRAKLPVQAKMMRTALSLFGAPS
jgi:lycopene cyclase-like protein